MTTDTMTTPAAGRTPVWFWIVAGLALLWEAMGCYAYVSQVSMTEEAMAKLPAEQVAIWKAMPVWATAAYAIAVWAGLAGAIALLMRRKWAQPLFLVSLLGVIVQFGWTFLGTDILKTMPIGQSAPFPAFIAAVAALLVWFSGWAGKKGLLR